MASPAHHPESCIQCTCHPRSSSSILKYRPPRITPAIIFVTPSNNNTWLWSDIPACFIMTHSRWYGQHPPNTDRLVNARIITDGATDPDWLRRRTINDKSYKICKVSLDEKKEIRRASYRAINLRDVRRPPGCVSIAWLFSSSLPTAAQHQQPHKATERPDPALISMNGRDLQTPRSAPGFALSAGIATPATFPPSKRFGSSTYYTKGY